jgi:hypothetical protein
MSTQNPLQTTFPIWPCGESQGAAIPNPEKGIVAKWNNYFGKNVNDLAKWKQLCSDLDKSADTFTTKTQCQKVGSPHRCTGRKCLDSQFYGKIGSYT